MEIAVFVPWHEFGVQFMAARRHTSTDRIDEIRLRPKGKFAAWCQIWGNPRYGRVGERATAMQQAMIDGAYAPLEELLAAPFRATVIRQLS